MVALPMRRREEVYGYISTVLRETLAEELARLPSKASYECLASVVSALQTVVSSAIKDFSEQWAVPHVDPLMALPSELVAECFAHLDLRGRIAVSHVSQAWRSLALAERTLWNAYEVGRTRPARALEALLLRSRPAPFRLTYEHIHYDSDSDGILEIALRNMERMDSLTLGSGAALPRLFDPGLTLWAPQLKFLECGRWDGDAASVAIPAEWAARCAPRLEVLVLRLLSLPSRCAPFASLVKLDTYLPEDGFPADLSLPEVFPNLRELRLTGNVRRFLRTLAPLPRSIEAVWLGLGIHAIQVGLYEDAIDYAQFVRACADAGAGRIRQLRLPSASRFSDALALFARTSTGPWEMHVHDEQLRLEAAAEAMLYEISCQRAISLAREPDAPLERLGNLTLSLRAFIDMHQLGTRVLPALRSLALFVITDDDIEAGRALVARTASDSPTQLSLPALESLKLLPGNETDFTLWLAQDAPALLPLLLRGSTLPLASIRLRIFGTPRLAPEDRDRLLPLARRVVVQFASFPGMAELVFDAGLPGSGES